MTTEIALAYCAGLIDGEGCILVKKQKPYHHLTGCVSPKYTAAIQVRMVDEGAIAFLTETLGGTYFRENTLLANRRPLFCWSVTQAKAETAIRLIRPYLRVKYAAADNVLRLRELQATGWQHRTKVVGSRNFPNKYGTARTVLNKSFSDEYLGQLEEAYLLSRQINKVGT